MAAGGMLEADEDGQEEEVASEDGPYEQEPPMEVQQQYEQ